jgi:hypothetical protein
MSFVNNYTIGGTYSGGELIFARKDGVTYSISLSGLDTNFANTNLTFSGNRTHDASGYNLNIENIGHFRITGVSGSTARLIIDAPNATDPKVISWRTGDLNRFSMRVDGSDDNLDIRRYDNGGNNLGSAFHINRSTGNIGIGTNTPLTKLHLVGTGGNTFFIDAYTNGTAPLLGFRRARGTEASPTAILNGDAFGSIGGRGHNGTSIPNNTRVSVILRASEDWTTTDNGTRLEFWTTENGTTTTNEKMRIDHNGNVGIGTTTPGDKLHIVGAYRADRFIDNTTGALFIGRKARGTEAAPTNVLNGDTLLQLLGRGWVDGDFNTGARVSINLFADEDWTPTALGTAIRFTTTNNGSLSTTIKMTIKNDGKVGIGTQTPTELLEVNGNIKANRFLGVSDIQRMPFKQNTDITHTGTLTNTIIASYLVPAGTFDVNDILRFRGQLNVTNNANAKNVRCYFNTSVSLAGAIQVSVRNPTSAQGGSFARDLVFANSLSSQKILNPTTNIADDENAATISSTLSIDFSVDQYFIVAVQLADVSDTVTLRWLRSEILR